MKVLDTLPSLRTRRLVVICGLALAAAVCAVAVLVYLDGPRTVTLPLAIQSVAPEPQSNVLSQSAVVVDLAVGYAASIDINGVPIPGDQISAAAALNQFRFQPGASKVIERLFPDQNCVRVSYWVIARGPESSQTYSWCFFAS